MKVFEISDFNCTGGASIAASRIANSLIQRKIDIIRVSSDSSNSNKALFQGRKAKFISNILTLFNFNRYRKIVIDRETLLQFRNLLDRFKPDNILIHNIHGANWPISMISLATEYAPTTWTLHDCWSFTGMYYPSHSPKPNKTLVDEITFFWKTVNGKPTRNPLSAITPSVWMRNQASASYWKNMNVKTIHNPIPKNFFEPRDRIACKKALGLNLKMPIVLCIAGNLEEKRKGGSILNEILSSCKEQDIQFLLIGKMEKPLNDLSKVKSLGFVRDEVTLQIAYHASDILIHPAPIDNLPNTVAESMCCGTPILAFSTGGIPEMVISGKSGWLVDEINTKSLKAKLDWILSNKDYERQRDSTRKLAHHLFQAESISKNYLDHFESLHTQL